MFSFFYWLCLLGIFKALPKLIAKIPDLIKKLVETFGNNLDEFYKIGEEIVKGIWEGIKATWKAMTEIDLPQLQNKLISKFMELFGIHSPSTVMRDRIGKYLGLGIAEGINDTVGNVENAMSNLSGKVEASVNPTINPTANSNPLYITIDKFYNNRQTDIQQLAEELEFYRRNSALAKGGV